MVFVTPLLFLCFLHLGNCWTTEDLELFDLVESTPQTFYQVLGVDEKASTIDIRKAYRKLSTLLHPDRNKNENAEEEFRRVAAVADVLRNDEKRKTYDLILKMGLPDWRAPIYYYRRVRNMGLFELAIFLFCLATFFQYIYAWTAYWEKKYEIEEVVLSRIRKKAKHQRKGSNAKIEEALIISEAMSVLQKPRCQDLFPVRLFYFMIHVIKSSPSYMASCRNYIKLRKPVVKEEEIEEPPAPRVKSRKLVAKPKIPDYTNLPSYEMTSNCTPSSLNETSQKEDHKEKKWNVDNLTEHQASEFKKALKKFPNGTLQRWEKVASYLDCAVSDVVTMVKQQKNQQFSKAVPTSAQGVTGTEKENFGFELYEEKGCEKNGINHAATADFNEDMKHQNGNIPNGINGHAEKVWKQEEQQALEIALQKFPKDTPSRWEKISGFVSTKTKEECVERFKMLAQQVKKKKDKGL